MKHLLISTTLLALPAAADIYEQRTYTPHEGKMEDLISRFRDHTVALFESHGIKNIGYWVTLADGEEPQKLTYIVVHTDMAAARKNWADFKNDPKWLAVYKESTVNGKLVKEITSEYMMPVDFSQVHEMRYLSEKELVPLRKKSRSKADLKIISSAMDMYKIHNGSYPSTEQGIQALVSPPNPRPKRWVQLANKVPVDAWGTPYTYELKVVDRKEKTKIISYGPDKQLGTDDDLVYEW